MGSVVVHRVFDFSLAKKGVGDAHIWEDSACRALPVVHLSCTSGLPLHDKRTTGSARQTHDRQQKALHDRLQLRTHCKIPPHCTTSERIMQNNNKTLKLERLGYVVLRTKVNDEEIAKVLSSCEELYEDDKFRDVFSGFTDGTHSDPGITIPDKKRSNVRFDKE